MKVFVRREVTYDFKNVVKLKKSFLFLARKKCITTVMWVGITPCSGKLGRNLSRAQAIISAITERERAHVVVNCVRWGELTCGNWMNVPMVIFDGER